MFCMLQGQHLCVSALLYLLSISFPHLSSSSQPGELLLGFQNPATRPCTWEASLLLQSQLAFLPTTCSLSLTPASPITGYKQDLGIWKSSPEDRNLLDEKEHITIFSRSPLPELRPVRNSGPGNVCFLNAIITKLVHKCSWNEGRDFEKGDWCL